MKAWCWGAGVKRAYSPSTSSWSRIYFTSSPLVCPIASACSTCTICGPNRLPSWLLFWNFQTDWAITESLNLQGVSFLKYSTGHMGVVRAAMVLWRWPHRKGCYGYNWGGTQVKIGECCGYCRSEFCPYLNRFDFQASMWWKKKRKKKVGDLVRRSQFWRWGKRMQRKRTENCWKHGLICKSVPDRPEAFAWWGQSEVQGVHFKTTLMLQLLSLRLWLLFNVTLDTILIFLFVL